jgi:hypothetical protein
VRRAVLAAGLALALAPAAAQAGVLDQRQESAPLRSVINGPGVGAQSKAQTFTAGKTGVLDQVELYLEQGSGTASLTVEIRKVVAGGAPGGSADVLASATILDASVPVGAEFVAATFSPPAPVVAGTQYAIVAYTSGVTRYLLGVDGSDPYAGGTGYGSPASPPASWTQFPNADFAFRTFVVVTDQGDQDDQGDLDEDG